MNPSQDGPVALNRRDFLRTLVAASVAAAIGKSGLSAFAADGRPFEFLVVGDSLVWGQGLEEKDKFYSLTADWLRQNAFGGPREVDLKVKAHSGATIRFDAKEAEKYRAAGKDENHFYKGEVNISTPSMFKQVEVAAAEYRSSGRERGADLVMLTAGITDISVEGVLDPFGDVKNLPPLIEEVCRGRVGALLERISELNPDAIIALVGYFPIISERSSSSKVFNGWLETLNVPSFFQGLLNNPLIRPIAFGRLLKKAIKRSRIWITESNRHLEAAVTALNQKEGRRRAIFIKAPLTEDDAVETANTKLFRMRKDGTVEDPLYNERKADCKIAFDELKRTTGIDQSARRCSFAAVGHPDPVGSKLYADAVIKDLSPLLQNR